MTLCCFELLKIHPWGCANLYYTSMSREEVKPDRGMLMHLGCHTFWSFLHASVGMDGWPLYGWSSKTPFLTQTGAPINFFWVIGLHWESTSRFPNSKNFWESGRFPRFSDLESQLTSSFIATSRFVSRMSAEEDAMVARRALIEILHGMYLGLLGIGMMTYSKWWCWETIGFGLPIMDGMFVNLLFLQGHRKQSCCSYKDVANLCEWVEWFPSFCLAGVVFGRE